MIEKKSSKYDVHINLRSLLPSFHMARATRRNAVTDATDSKRFFFGRRPLPFGGSPLEAHPWTSGESNRHRQSVRVAKNDALPTEPRGHLQQIRGEDLLLKHFSLVGGWAETYQVGVLGKRLVTEMDLFVRVGKISSFRNLLRMTRSGFSQKVNSKQIKLI